MTMEDKLLHRALTDSDTGLPNARFFDMERQSFTDRSERYGFPVGVVTITCHSCGMDTFLEFSRRVAESVRRADHLARTDFSQLKLLITHRDTEMATRIMERIHALADNFEEEAFTVDVDWSVEGAPPQPA